MTLLGLLGQVQRHGRSATTALALGDRLRGDRHHQATGVLEQRAQPVTGLLERGPDLLLGVAECGDDPSLGVVQGGHDPSLGVVEGGHDPSLGVVEGGSDRVPRGPGDWPYPVQGILGRRLHPLLRLAQCHHVGPL
jgi:hypothetical protein